MTWTDWAAGVLSGIGAPGTAVNLDSLWAWSGKESGIDRMRWNNPLNTTQPWAGAQNMNSVGVKRYATVQDGISATVTTLLNGFYPGIVGHLRQSVPRSSWTDVCGELGIWGTGCGWLNGLYGSAPGSIVSAEDDMTDLQDATLTNTSRRISAFLENQHSWTTAQGQVVQMPVTLADLTAQSTAISADLAVIKALVLTIEERTAGGATPSPFPQGGQQP
jgi:hypothetical protein